MNNEKNIKVIKMDIDKIINSLNKFNFVLINDFKGTKFENLCLDFTRIIDGIGFIYHVSFLENEQDDKILFCGDTSYDHDDWENCQYKQFFKNEDDLIENWNRIWFLYPYDELENEIQEV